ncbi:2OG-Fe(II) oxygenase [Stenotrophomonas maltophilia]|uniref:2OG-Fe(II) oxygenase n=1 Tax=Stenotrophomonas maltophilia TaxID=40324 RepID=UPI0021C8B271|nr:2OG-Fe(II) oxygenase [Stenotrophomonas maltophilia]MCU1126493.1 2OG-Fe(II) oxygenase [Stenotrophomonas maltophilia]
METSQLARSIIRTWLESGMSREAVVATFHSMGWHPQCVTQALEQAEVESDALPARYHAGSARERPWLDLDALPTELNLQGRRIRIQARQRRPELCVFSNFLDANECEAIIALARPGLRRSLVNAGEASGNSARVVSYARTSEQVWIPPGADTLVDTLQDRVCQLTHWPAARMEHLQVVRYGVGADFSPHYDYFVEGSKAQRSGQRVATIIMYLNTPAGGGATSFPDIELEIYPQQGNALYFAYPDATPSERTLHAGVPLMEGEKWIATFFLRDVAILPLQNPAAHDGQ